jgi:hypothetical protein
MEDTVMNSSEVLAEFSRNRLGGERVPDDLRLLLPHRDELVQRTGIRLEWIPEWNPWLESIHLRENERTDPDGAASLFATEEICRLTAFVAALESGEYFGYWRGPTERKVAESPLVFLDREGHFHLCVASSFAEAILAREFGGARFTKLRAWFRALGIPIGWENPEQLTYPYERHPPRDLHKELFARFRSELRPVE